VVSYTFWSPYVREKGHWYLLDRRHFRLPELVRTQWRADISLRLLGVTERKRINTIILLI
jgi:hypothetical protein